MSEWGGVSVYSIYMCYVYVYPWLTSDVCIYINDFERVELSDGGIRDRGKGVEVRISDNEEV